MPPERLVYMANQIARFFQSQGDAEAAVSGIADHLEKFWDPGMRAAIIGHLKAGGEGLLPLTRQAVGRLRS